MPWTIFDHSRYPSALRWVRRCLLTPVKKESAYVNGEKMTGAALEVLDRFARRQPFFLFLNYMDAHWPYAPPEPFRSRFGAPSRNMSGPDHAELERAVHSRKRTITDAEQRDLMAAY